MIIGSPFIIIINLIHDKLPDIRCLIVIWCPAGPDFVRFYSINLSLIQKFNRFQVVERKRGKNIRKLRPLHPDMKKPNKTDLMYLEDSPDYCEPNAEYVSKTVLTDLDLMSGQIGRCPAGSNFVRLFN